MNSVAMEAEQRANQKVSDVTRNMTKGTQNLLSWERHPVELSVRIRKFGYWSLEWYLFGTMKARRGYHLLSQPMFVNLGLTSLTMEMRIGENRIMYAGVMHCSLSMFKCQSNTNRHDKEMEMDNDHLVGGLEHYLFSHILGC